MLGVSGHVQVHLWLRLRKRFVVLFQVVEALAEA